MWVSAGQHNGSACAIWPEDWLDQHGRCRGLCYLWQTRAVLPSKEVRFRALALAKERDGPCSKEDEVGLESYDGCSWRQEQKTTFSMPACFGWLWLKWMPAIFLFLCTGWSSSSQDWIAKGSGIFGDTCAHEHTCAHTCAHTCTCAHRAGLCRDNTQSSFS